MSDEVITSEKAGYHVEGTWHQYDNLRCNFCAFDSVVEAQIQKHVAETHYFELLGEQVEIPLEAEIYDAFGRKVESRRATREELAELECRLRQARSEQ